MHALFESVVRLVSAGALILLSATIFGCGGGSSGSTAPIVEEPPADAVVTGAQLARSLRNTALVGQPYQSNVVVVPNDSRNSVVALAIANPSPSLSLRSATPNGINKLEQLSGAYGTTFL